MARGQLNDCQQVAFAVLEPGRAAIGHSGGTRRLVEAGEVILFEPHAPLLQIAHLSLDVSDAEAQLIVGAGRRAATGEEQELTVREPRARDPRRPVRLAGCRR